MHEVCAKFKHIITIEDGCVMGGMGTAVLEFIADHNYQISVKRLGIPDEVIEQGEQIELQAQCGFDIIGICASARKLAGVSAAKLMAS